MFVSNIRKTHAKRWHNVTPHDSCSSLFCDTLCPALPCYNWKNNSVCLLVCIPCTLQTWANAQKISQITLENRNKTKRNKRKSNKINPGSTSTQTENDFGSIHFYIWKTILVGSSNGSNEWIELETYKKFEIPNWNRKRYKKKKRRWESGRNTTANTFFLRPDGARPLGRCETRREKKERRRRWYRV